MQLFIFALCKEGPKLDLHTFFDEISYEIYLSCLPLIIDLPVLSYSILLLVKASLIIKLC